MLRMHEGKNRFVTPLKIIKCRNSRNCSLRAHLFCVTIKDNYHGI